MFVQHRHLPKFSTAICTVTVAALCTVSAGAPTSAARAASAPGWPQPAADAARSNHAAGETILTTDRIGRKGLSPAYSLSAVPPYGWCGGWFYRVRPVIAAGRIYVYDGRRVEARNLATGALVWRSADIAGPDGFNTVSSLAVADNRVLVSGIDTCPSVDLGTLEIRSLAVSDGHEVWFETLGMAAVSGSTVIVQNSGEFTANVFEARRVATGTTLWSRGAECGSSNTFVVGTHVVSNGSCGTMSLSTGATEWIKPGWRPLRGDPPGVSKPSIYAKSPSDSLVALSPAGTVRWDAGVGYGPVMAAGPRHVFAVCHDGDSVCALNRSTGALEWQHTPANPPGHNAASASDFLINPSDGHILRASDGADFGLGPVGDSIFGQWETAAVSNGRIILQKDRTIDVITLNK